MTGLPPTIAIPCKEVYDTRRRVLGKKKYVEVQSVAGSVNPVTVACSGSRAKR